MRNGAMTVNGGTVTTPLLKLGITSGNTGTYTQTAGTVTVGTMGIGNDASTTSGSGIGLATISGGILSASNLLIGSTAGGVGTVTISGLAQVNVGSLTISPGSTLDITNSRLFIDYGSGPDPIASIAQWIKNGYYGLSGPAIISSAITTDDALSGLSYGIGYADGADRRIRRPAFRRHRNRVHAARRRQS